MRALVPAVLAIATIARAAHADPDPRRKVIVLEYRASSSALPGIARRLVDVLAKQTSLAVLGPDQTRAIYGEHLGQAIVRCGGEAECIAQIGQKVGAAEVVLVGVSELGDVILTMQRIDVASHAVETRIADSIPAGTTPSDQQIDQYLSRLMPPSDFLRFGVIDVIASQAGARVTIGGQKRGATPIQPVKLRAPALYDVRVEKDGFVPFTTKVQLPPDATFRVNATLQRPGGGAAWWQHWYVITAAALIVGGAAGTTIYFTTLKTSDRVNVGGMLH
ncbi:MAG TPA: PEGA domain-containing protein [Kofleriaceae bacterium]|nr:PEGA domain-containing protein [Kofleriaceae bacterium]